MALNSKISRLPRTVRDELNRRLDDGAKGPELLPWLNGLPETQAMLKKHYGGIEISDQNLSNWRETGFAEWQSQQQHVIKIKRMSELAMSVAGNAGDILKGARAISAGHLMQVLENLDPDAQEQLLAENPENFPKLLGALASISSAHTSDDTNTLRREKLKDDKERLRLDREKFEMMAAKALLKHALSPEIQKVIKGGGSNADKIAALRARMFPQRATT